MPIIGRKNCAYPSSINTTCCILGTLILPPCKYHLENEQDNCKLHMGWQIRTKKISSYYNGKDLYSKEFRWMGTIGPEDFWEGTLVKITVERDLWRGSLEHHNKEEMYGR